ESAHQVTILMSDRGTPRTYRHMNGYSSSTYLWENAAGKKVWVKYHFKTEQGIQNFTDAEATAMKAEDPDYHRRDLNAAIARKDYPVWRLEMQIMPDEDAVNYPFNPFDLTKVWPHKDYPTIPIGRMVLDRNPENFFAEIVQAGFEVANFVPGIGPSPDRMVLGRMFAYGDSNRYRNGANYEQLPVNRPLNEVHNYNKDGPMRYRHNGSQPVSAQNSHGRPRPGPRGPAASRRGRVAREVLPGGRRRVWAGVGWARDRVSVAASRSHTEPIGVQTERRSRSSRA